MKKIISILLSIIFPFAAIAQDKIVTEKITDKIKNSTTIQELKNDLVNEYGIKNVKFIQSKDGKFFPLKKDYFEKNLNIQNNFDGVYLIVIGGLVLLVLIIVGIVVLANSGANN